MKYLLLCLLLLALPSSAWAATAEVLVETTPTALPALRFRRLLFIQNLGPHDIFCADTSAAAVVNKAVRVAANGGTLSLSAANAFWCVAATADQVTGAATIVLELT